MLRKYLINSGIIVQETSSTAMESAIAEVQELTGKPRRVVLNSAITLLEMQAYEGRMIVEV